MRSNEERKTQFAAKHEILQGKIDLIKFTLSTDMREEIRQSIKKAKSNKSPVVDGVHHEMLKVDAHLASELIYVL